MTGLMKVPGTPLLLQASGLHRHLQYLQGAFHHFYWYGA